jgi:hypothetical protein
MWREVDLHAYVGAGQQVQGKGSARKLALDDGWRYCLDFRVDGLQGAEWFVGLCEPDKDVWAARTDCVGFCGSAGSTRMALLVRRNGEEKEHLTEESLHEGCEKRVEFELYQADVFGVSLRIGIEDVPVGTHANQVKERRHLPLHLGILPRELSSHLPLGRILTPTAALGPGSHDTSYLVAMGGVMWSP